MLIQIVPECLFMRLFAQAPDENAYRIWNFIETRNSVRSRVYYIFLSLWLPIIEMWNVTCFDLMQFHFNNKINYFLFQIKMYTFNLKSALNRTRAHIDKRMPMIPITKPKLPIESSQWMCKQSCRKYSASDHGILFTVRWHVSKQIRYVNFHVMPLSLLYLLVWVFSCVVMYVFMLYPSSLFYSTSLYADDDK